MIKRIGFIGIGIMGEPMTKNLISAGYQLAVYDINRAGVERLATDGAKATSFPKEAATSRDMVITMLPDDRVVQEAVLGKGGAIEGMSKGSILVDMSTISPKTARNIVEILEENGMEMIDAPVSGGDVGAKEATLSIMVGGNIRGYTRTITTAISLETSKGELELSIALGIILIFVALVINLILNIIQQR